MSKPSVFISYAHKDAMEFTQRLAFALSMYMDVFYDKRLPTGKYPIHLLNEIERRDFFILVMSPYSLRAGGWCMKEFEHARKHKSDRIALARLVTDCGNPTLERELESKYTYGDFTHDFEQGFRRITQMTLGNPYSSWEALPRNTDANLLDCLKKGVIPGLISKEIAEWVIVERLWSPVESYSAKKDFPIFRGSPRTPVGILQQCTHLQEQYEWWNDEVGSQVVEQVGEIAKIYVEKLFNCKDDDHNQSGRVASEIVTSTRQALATWAEMFNDVPGDIQIMSYFEFDVAEKLREFINMHARRSRYLY